MTYLRQSGRKCDFARLVLNHALIMGDIVNHGTSENSTANLMQYGMIEVPFKCRVDKIGFFAGGEMNSGNFMLALYDSDPVTLVPKNLICAVASTAVAGKPDTVLQFYAPTTTPIINAGLYYVGIIFSANYAAGTTGGRIFFATFAAAAINVWNDAITPWYNQAVGSFTVPNPATPVAYGLQYLFGAALKVTVV